MPHVYHSLETRHFVINDVDYGTPKHKARKNSEEASNTCTAYTFTSTSKSSVDYSPNKYFDPAFRKLLNWL